MTALSRKQPQFRSIVLAARLFIARVGERDRWWPSRLWDGAGDVALRPLFADTWARQRLLFGYIAARTAEDRNLSRVVGDTRQSLFRLAPKLDAAIEHDLRLIDLSAAEHLDIALEGYTGTAAAAAAGFAALARRFSDGEDHQVVEAFAALCDAYGKEPMSPWAAPVLAE